MCKNVVQRLISVFMFAVVAFKSYCNDPKFSETGRSGQTV